MEFCGIDACHKYLSSLYNVDNDKENNVERNLMDEECDLKNEGK